MTTFKKVLATARTKLQFTNRIIHGNCIDVMKKMPAASIDLVIADPPYLVNYRSRDGRTFANDNGKNPYWLKPAYAQIYRVLKKDSLCISFYGFTQTEKFMWTWKKVGFGVADQIIYIKKYASSTGFVERRHEAAHLLSKGEPPKPQNILPSVLNWDYTGNRLHPSQKPIKAITPLIETFSRTNDIILDPFVGSGTTAAAAKLTGREYVGIEISREYCEIAQKRVANINTQ